MNLRAVIIALSAAGIPLALVICVLPLTWGYAGFLYTPWGTRSPHVVFLDSAGPAARAGIRSTDRVIPTAGYMAVLDQAGPAGSTVTYKIVRNDGTHDIPVTFEPFRGGLAVQEQFNKILGALTAFGAFIVAILVALRAREPKIGMLAAAILMVTGIGALMPSLALVWPSAWAGVFLTLALPRIITNLVLWLSLLLLALYPPNAARLRRFLPYTGAFAFALAIAVATAGIYRVWTGTFVPVLDTLLDLTPAFTPASMLVVIITGIFITQIVAAMAEARGANRTPTRWLGTMWIAAAVTATLPLLFGLAGNTILSTHYGDFLKPLQVFFLAFGVAYPVLRHRLIDLNLFVTRATVFAVVSAIIVGVFIAAEWAVGKIFEHSFGISNDRGDLAAQIVTLGIVLVLGISARSIHRFVEVRLTQTFFRKRTEGLAALDRIAHEADSATDLRAYTDLAVRKVERALETAGAAFYLRRGEVYERTSHTGAADFADAYAFNDEAPLALRRWLRPFDLDDHSEGALHLLFLPMSVRGELVGFLCCGPKSDRTLFAGDEIAALALLADRAGIAQALLSRPPLTPLSLDAAVRT